MRSSSLYIRLVRRARKFLRSKLFKKFPLVIKALKPLFNKVYWVPTPHRAGLGLAIGLFFAFVFMLIPVQTMGAALICLLLKGNLPIALGACWVTNPFTVPFLIKPLEWLGSKCQLESINLSNHTLTIPVFKIDVNYAHFVVGTVLFGIILSLSSYPLYRLISMAFPKRKNRKAITHITKEL